jgi:FtsZ-binding cell division protein ZapB
MHPELVANKLGIREGSLYRLTRHEHLSSERLLQLGQVLDYDFFEELRRDDGARERQQTLGQELLKAQHANEELKRENEILRMKVTYLEEQVRGQKELIALLK